MKKGRGKHLKNAERGVVITGPNCVLDIGCVLGLLM